MRDSRSTIAWLHEAGRYDLPDEVAAQARRCLLDLVGVGVAGSRTLLSSIIRDHAHRCFGGSQARLMLDGRTVSAAGAALAGGMTIDAVDAHDGHPETKGHAGCGLLPGLLALSESAALDDPDSFITSLVVGYEIAIRAGISLHRTVADYHTSGAWVALATAALGARLFGLDHERTRHALGIAEYHGPRSQMMRCIDHPSMLKDGSGWGAMAGVSAAFLAEAGFTGAPALTHESEAVSQVWGDLGERWRILEQYFKPLPVCRWAQPPIYAASTLLAAHEVRPEEIAHIEVESFGEATRLACREPKNTEEAQYSLPYALAAFIVFGRLTADEIDGRSLRDERVRHLASRIRLIEDGACAHRFPAERWARTSLVMEDGRRLESPWSRAEGDAALPLDDAALEKKFMDYAVPVLGEEGARALRRAVDGVSAGEVPLSALTDELCRPPPRG